MNLRSLAIGLYAFAADLVAGPVLGASYPGRKRRFPERDARERALAALRRYVAAVPVSDPEKEGTFRLDERDVHADFADPEQEPALPAAGVVSAEADVSFEYLGGPILLEDSFGKYGDRTALALRGWHQEELTLEVWCRTVPERRAVVAALKGALWASADRGSLDLRLDDYFGQTARFWLVGAWVPDEPESLRGGRRRALLKLRLRVAEVVLVDAGTMRPLAEVDVAVAGVTSC